MKSVTLTLLLFISFGIANESFARNSRRIFLRSACVGGACKVEQTATKHTVIHVDNDVRQARRLFGNFRVVDAKELSPAEAQACKSAEKAPNVESVRVVEFSRRDRFLQLPAIVSRVFKIQPLAKGKALLIKLRDNSLERRSNRVNQRQLQIAEWRKDVA